MIVSTPFYDRKKRIAIVPELVDVCLKCGRNAYPNREGKRACISCRSTETGRIYENQLDTFRRGLAEREHEKALVLVGKLLPQVDELRNVLNCVADYRGDELAFNDNGKLVILREIQL